MNKQSPNPEKYSFLPPAHLVEPRLSYDIVVRCVRTGVPVVCALIMSAIFLVGAAYTTYHPIAGIIGALLIPLSFILDPPM